MMKVLLLLALLITPAALLADDLSTIIEYSGIEKSLVDTNRAFIQDAYQSNPNLAEKSELVERYFSDNVAFSNFKPELEKLLNESFNTAELGVISGALSKSDNRSELLQFYGTELGQRWLNVDSQFNDIVLLGAVTKIMDPEHGLASFLQQQ